MIRVYLDWNVYSRIKNSDKEFYPELRNILLNNSKYCFPYSTAHLMDIYESYKKVGWSDIQSHVTSLELSNSLNLKQVFGEKPAFYINDSTNELKSYILERHPSEKFGEIEKTNESDYIDYFPETTKFLDEQDKISEITDSIISNFQNFTNSFLRENFKEDYQKGLNINKGKLLNKKTNKIDYLNENSIKNGYDSFLSYNDEIIYKINKNPNFIDELTSLFTSIDISGYGQDTTVLSSTITDSIHCAYASTCDIFIVDDRRTYLKSKEVYNLKNLSVKTFRPNEFITFYKNHLLEFKNGQDILNFTFDIPNHAEPIFKTKTENIYYLESYLFDFFNVILVNNIELRDPKTIHLFKFPANNKLALLTLEKEDLLEKLNSTFGKPNLISDNWKETGILNCAWIYNKIELIKLSIDNSEVSLSFIKCKKKE